MPDSSKENLDLSNYENEWFVLELKVCRAVAGLTQRQLAELTGMALQSIKRLEKKGSQPRYTTLNKIRAAFKTLGVKCHFDEYGEIRVEMRPLLVKALNEGKHKAYITSRKKLVE